MPATFLVVPEWKKEMQQGLWGSLQHRVHFGYSHFKFKAFYMAADWETFQNLQEAGKESSITKSILTETEELANKHMWNVPLFVTTRGTVFPTNTRSIWERTVTTCLCGYDPCCPAKGSFKQAIPPPHTLPSFYPVIFPVLLPFYNRWYFPEILDLQNDSSVMQMGSFAEIRIHLPQALFYRTEPYIFLELFATISLLPNPFLSRSCSYIQTPFPVALVWLEFILSFSS